MQFTLYVFFYSYNLSPISEIQIKIIKRINDTITDLFNWQRHPCKNNIVFIRLLLLLLFIHFNASLLQNDIWRQLRRKGGVFFFFFQTTQAVNFSNKFIIHHFFISFVANITFIFIISLNITEYDRYTSYIDENVTFIIIISLNIIEYDRYIMYIVVT